jgi:hypothetical protein
LLIVRSQENLLSIVRSQENLLWTTGSISIWI